MKKDFKIFINGEYYPVQYGVMRYFEGNKERVIHVGCLEGKRFDGKTLEDLCNKIKKYKGSKV